MRMPWRSTESDRTRNDAEAVSTSQALTAGSEYAVRADRRETIGQMPMRQPTRTVVLVDCHTI